MCYTPYPNNWEQLKWIQPNWNQPNFSTTKTSRKKPSAHIAVKKSRLKSINKNVYLNDGTEYEIELFNPDTITYGVKIEIDGNLISSSLLVLKPGERIFLKRYLDENKSLIFKTYIVNSNDKEVLDAINDNGEIIIYFYPEKTVNKNNFIFSSSGGTSTINNWHDTVTTRNVFFSNTSNLSSQDFSDETYGTLDSLSNNKFEYSDASEFIKKEYLKEKDLETGRTEKGKETDQKFTTVNIDFDSIYSHHVEWKLLPLSVKPIEKKEAEKSYCTNCGTKNKTNWKFCPTCGTKI